ncbi:MULTISPECIES: type I secretion system permease/ATPase [Pseudodesulfovibrio]|uniref:Type I secretion system ATPase n=1 Tax=Pseudodesulfovibrio aespoeensis (strain ATCC 700646 / DSM 10631 / Aspo-2) TaxID=643562 RepID=E6VRY1_PSEA9|nr:MULTISPECIES: type I secretion system permease/ATPase [Pseudodesulfovibrio]ADU61914.1 type I secretion system ATPase [Pseudodesulfovibrio aespoeensis Aspo-2]MCG2732139.1 type I secretion system permease/ATPase [Pseudodesulfovibrio aespoeensis]
MPSDDKKSPVNAGEGAQAARPDARPRPEPKGAPEASRKPAPQAAAQSAQPGDGPQPAAPSAGPAPDLTGDERLSPKDIDFQPPLVICLSIISRLMGKPVSSATLKAGIPQQEGIITAASIVRAAERIGITAKTVHRPGVRNITKLVLPCILLLRGGNACVLLDTGEDTARVMVPGHGMDETEMALSTLEEEYTGYAIFCHRKSTLDKRASALKLIRTKRWFWGVLLRFWPIYRHVIGASIMTNLIIVASPLFVMNVYDRVIPNNALDTLWALAIGIAIAYLFDFLLKNLRSYFVDVAGRNADVLIGSRIMQHLMSARLDHMPESAGAVANNVREFESLREFFSSSSLVALIDMPFLLLFIGVVHYIGGPLAWPIFVAVPVVILFGLFLQMPFQHIIESHYKESTQKNALLFEIVQGLETIKTSMAEGRMQARWENVVGMSALSNSRAKIMANLSVTFSVFITQMVSVAIIIIGVYLIAEGELTVGGLIACNILAGRAMAPLSAVAGLLSRFQQSRMALGALDMLMEMPSERPEDKETFHYGAIEPSMVLDNVSFSYPGTDKAVLSEVTLRLKPGDKVGIVGRTGAGKSTVGKLCVGLYQPVAGSVKVGDIDLRQMDVADLRRKVGYVSQDSLLFYGTLRDNIAFGLPEADDQSIKFAAEIAGVNDFVRDHPAGYGMMVGERGSSLSGGQRQAVCIARAILPDPEILIMDEPSSNMDNQSEYRFKAMLESYIKDKTLIVITHRHSMLDLVDRLVIMDKGRVVVDGPKQAVLDGLKSGKIKVSM